MEPFYFLDYIKDDKFLDRNKYDSLRYELDKHIYFFGNHFINSYENEHVHNKFALRKYARILYCSIIIMQNSKINCNKMTILSNAYFNVNEELEKLNYNVFCPSWQMSKNRKVLSNFSLLLKSEKLMFKFQNLNFNELISEDFLSEISEFQEELIDFFYSKNIKSIFVPNDVSFFENLSIQICKKLKRPSFTFLHGIPGRYNHIDENRSDYLVVWGEKIKENYINHGFSPNKIFVSGHPYYKEFKKRDLEFSLNNILVLTKAVNGANHSTGVILSDRGNSLLYLYSIEKTLKTFGIKSVRFRPHPSESSMWYQKFINNDFFKLDTDVLSKSIINSSLIIGPTSTVFIESLYFGKNYLIYEPSCDNNVDITNYNLVPPFNGNDSKIPVAFSEDDLKSFIKNKIKVDSSCFNEYIKTSFDLNFIKSIIN